MATVGTIAAFINYTRQFGRPLNDIANLYNTIQAADRRGRAGLRDHRRGAGDRRPRRDRRRCTPSRASRLRGRRVSATSRACRSCATSACTRSRGNWWRWSGPTGAGKTTDRQPADPLLRDRQRPDHDRRAATSATITKDDLRRQLGHRAAGHLPLRRDGRGQHPLRAARRDRRGGDRRGDAWPTPTSSSTACRTATTRRSPSGPAI